MKLPQVQNREDSIQSVGDRQLTHDYSQSEIPFENKKPGYSPDSPLLRKKKRNTLPGSVGVSPKLFKLAKVQPETVPKRAKIINLSLSET